MARIKHKKSNILTIIFLFTFFVSCSKPVQLPGDNPTKQTISKMNHFNVCLKQDHLRPNSDALSCFGQQMLQKLQDLEEMDQFQLADGISMQRDEAGPRDISNFLDRDPMDLKSIVEGASTLMSKRAMQWDMSFIYPGLNMRIGPTLTGNGLLEFVMDPRIRDRESIDGHEASTARLITKSLLVPFLLGFKFQLSTLLPLLFGVMVLLSKKALILAKIAVIASTVFGYNSLFGGGQGQQYGYYGGPGLSAYGNRYHGQDFYKNNENINEESDPYYGTASNHHGGVYKHGPAHSPEDLRDRLERLFAAKHGKDGNGGRNFAWNN